MPLEPDNKATNDVTDEDVTGHESEVLGELSTVDRTPTVSLAQGDTGERPGETVMGDSVRTASLPAVGTRFGQYVLVEEVGRGGVGVVYRAEQSRPARSVALKVLHGGSRAEALDVQRLHAEADAAAALDHRSIVPVFEVGECDGCHFLAMGFVEGETLAERLRRGPLTGREAAPLLKRIAEAIAFAHDAGIVHRDLKPSNIMLDAGGEPRVTDFGLAKQLGSDGQLTATGQIVGTPSYMAPEQATGRTKDVGPAVDVYALGGVLYCMLTGRPPFQAATLTDTLIQVAQNEPVPPSVLNPSIERDLETICLKCLEKSPERRYGSASEVAEELGRFVDGLPLRARRVGTFGRAVRWCRRNSAVATLVGVVAVSLLLGTVISTYFALQARSRSEEIERLSRELVALALEVRDSEAVDSDEDGPVAVIEFPEPEEDEPKSSDTEPGTSVDTVDLNVTPAGDPARADAEPLETADKTDRPEPRTVIRSSPPLGGSGPNRPGMARHAKSGRPARDLRMQYQTRVDRLRQIAPDLATEFSKAIPETPDPQPTVIGD